MKQQTCIALVCLCLLVFPLVSFSAGPAEPFEFSPVQNGFVSSGESVLPYAPDRVLVKFNASAMQTIEGKVGLQRGASMAGASTGIASVDAIGRDVGAVRISRPYFQPGNRAMAARLGVDRWFRVDVSASASIPDVVARYAADPNIESATPDWRAFPAAVPGDPLYADHWGHNNTGQLPDYDWGGTWDHTGPPVGTPGFDANAQAAWDNSQGFGSASIIIAILDSGVDIDHPDLDLVAGYDFGDNDSNPDDNSAQPGHGTCCAGVAASTVNNGIGACGAAPACRIMPCKVANNAGSMYFSSIQNALYWAADNGADVISMSFSANISSDPATDAALAYAYNAGVVLLAATSNENESHIRYPANHADVIGVGAASPCGDRKRSSSSSSELNPGVLADPNGYTCDGERWWGSNYGVTTPDAPGAVDVIAPTILPTTDIGGSGGYRPGDYEPFFNGTSCATPYAAGVCGLIKSKNPTWTNTQIRDQLCNTAIDIVNVESGTGWDRYSGYGMVDAAAATGGGGPVAPVADFSGDPTSGNEPLTVNFTDLSSGTPTSWSWDFGDGVGTSTVQNPSYTYTAAGTYTVTLTATNSVGSDDEIKVDYITVTTPPPPVADFNGSPTSGAYPLDVVFTDLSTNNPTAWSWDFGDGVGTSTLQNPSYTYTAAGTYTVTLTATNVYGSDDEIKVDYITVTEPGVTQFVTADSETPVTGTVSGSYTDTYTSNDVRESITEVLYTGHPRKTYSYLEHRWHFTIPAGGDVTFHLEASRTSGGDGDNFVFEYSTDGVNWSPLVTVASTTESPYTAALGALSGSVTVRAYDTLRDWGGTALDVLSVDYMAFEVGDAQPQPPVADFTGSPTSGSYPLDVAFTDLSTNNPTAWSWDFGDGAGTSTQQNPGYTYTAAGTYTVTLTATNAYGSDDEIKVDYITVTEPGSQTFITADSETPVAGTVSGSHTDTYTSDDVREAITEVLYTGHPRKTYSYLEHQWHFTIPAGGDVTFHLEASRTSGGDGDNFVFEYSTDGVNWSPLVTVASTTESPYTTALGALSGSVTVRAYDTDRSWGGTALDVLSVDYMAFEVGGSAAVAKRGGPAAAGEAAAPDVFSLAQNYPNPFNPETIIAFTLPGEGHVTLEVFTATGQRVAVLVNETRGPGQFKEVFDASRLSSGVYFYRLQAGSNTEIRKMVLLK